MDHVWQGCPICGCKNPCLFCWATDRLVRSPLRYRIMQCPGCRLAFTWEPDADRLPVPVYPPHYWGSVKEEIEKIRSGAWLGRSLWRMEQEKVDLVAKLRDGGRLLDVGAGIGKFLLALDRHRWQAEGVETEGTLVDLARHSFPELRLHSGSLGSLPLPEGAFDVVTFWHVFEHLPNPHETLAAVRRILAPGGRLVVSLPNVESWQALWFREDWFAFGEGSRHLYHYGPESLWRLLLQHGFHPQRILFFSRRVNFHCWKHSLRAWTSNRLGAPFAYYLLKPLLHLGPLLESVTRRWGVFTVVAGKEA